MSDFTSTAELSVSLDQGSLRDVRGEIESALSDIPVGVEAGDLGGGDSGGSTQQPRDPNSGQFMAIEGVEQRLVDQTAILTEVKDLADQRNAILGSSGGDTDSRERRRRRREFRWARQRTDFAEQQVALLEEIKDNVEDGGGGGGPLAAAGKKIGTGVVLGGAGVAAAGVGIGAGAGAAGAGIGLGSLKVGTAIADAIREEGIPKPEVNTDVTVDTSDAISLDTSDLITVQTGDLIDASDLIRIDTSDMIDVSDVINLDVTDAIDVSDVVTVNTSDLIDINDLVTFKPKLSAEFTQDVDISPTMNNDLSINFSPSLEVSPEFNPTINLGGSNSLSTSDKRDLESYADDAAQDVKSELSGQIDTLERRIERALN